MTGRFRARFHRLTRLTDAGSANVLFRDVLVNLQAKYGAHVDRREIRQDYRRGFSILKTNRETSARTCEIYLPNEMRPKKIDDEATLSLGHELLHCMLGDYHP